MDTIRLDKFLASQLQISRADAKKMLRRGEVAVRGRERVTPETQIDPARDAVFAGGREVTYRAHLYIMQHKPAGVVSATRDAEKTVLDLLPPALRRVGLFPAGRLDKDTTGLMLITDDGDFAHRMLSPAHHVEKAYEVTLERKVTQMEQNRILEGMRLGEEQLKPAGLRFQREENGLPVYEIVLTEGRYHQIKRMFGAQQNPVRALKRTRMGGLCLDETLSPGESRLLTEEEAGMVFKLEFVGDKFQ